MIDSNSIFGRGYNSFAVQYNVFQSNYIKNHDLPLPQQLLASDNYYAFNDLIQLTIEIGLLGSGIVLYILIVSFKILNRKEMSVTKLQPIEIGAISSILTIIICSLFSYPLRTFSVLLNCIFYMAIISKRLSPIFKVNFSKTIIRTSFLIFFVVFQVFAFREFQRMMALKIWEEAAHLALIDEFKTAKSKYDESEKILKENGPFLFNYGAEAFIAGYSTSESIRILERAKKHYTSTNLYIYLGNNYKILKNYAKAEGCYITAKYMQPSKFLSKFELLLLYKELNLKNKALAEAQEIINFPVKVPSSEVDNYKRYAQDFLESENKK